MVQKNLLKLWAIFHYWLAVTKYIIMPKVNLNQNNLTAGELTPKLYGRTDITRYSNAAKTIENAVPLIYGGVKNRDGTLFVKQAKFADKICVLIPFVVNTNISYMLEFGHLYMRVFTDDGQVMLNGKPYEIDTPYTDGMLRELDYQQFSDSMFIEHGDVPTQHLRRLSNTAWSIAPARFVVEPFDELGFYPPANITLSSTVAGFVSTFTASTGVFMTSDFGRRITSGLGEGEISTVVNATTVNVNILSDFISATIAQDNWRLDGSPVANLTPTIKDPVGAQVTLNLTAPGWRAEDKGKYIKINGGLVLITEVTSGTHINGFIKSALSAVVTSPAFAWSLNSPIWSSRLGYPRTGQFYEQRLLLAGSDGYPQSIAASSTGEYLNFQLGVADDDAFLFKIASTNEKINYLEQAKQLISLSNSGQFSISGGVEKPITPTNVSIKLQTNDSCSNVRPVNIGNELYYVNRTKKRLFASSYSFDIDGYTTVDISKTSDHILTNGVVDMAYSRDYDSLLNCVMANGTLATATIEKTENVNAWARQITDGAFEAVAVKPSSTSEDVWVVVRRILNEVEVRYIEKFRRGLYLDSAVSKANTTNSKIVTNLGHLEGRTVSVLADGMVLGNFTVASGSITLPRVFKSIQVGLPYETTIELLPIEVQGQSGSSQGGMVRTASATIKLLDTVGCKINNEQIPFRRFGEDVLDTSIKPFTGDKKISLLGWKSSGGGVVTIKQIQPLPMHVLSVVREVIIND